MPLYRYECESCDKILTMEYGINQRPSVIRCHCGGRAKYIMSAPNVVIKESFPPSNQGKRDVIGRIRAQSPIKRDPNDPIERQLDQMDEFHRDETGDDRDIERKIPNIDDPDLYKD